MCLSLCSKTAFMYLRSTLSSKKTGYQSLDTSDISFLLEVMWHNGVG